MVFGEKIGDWIHETGRYTCWLDGKNKLAFPADTRWENVWAEFKPLEADPDYPGREDWWQLLVEVRDDGWLWYAKQSIHKDDVFGVILAEDDVFGFLLDEMVEAVDGYIDEGKKEMTDAP